MTTILSAFGPLAAEYDALLCDAWGVIHNGVTLFDGVAEALSRFRAERGPVIILTNAPRPSRIIPAQLDRLGLPRDAYDAVVTSGDATRAAIRRFLPEPAFRIGPPRDDALYDDLGVNFVPLGEARFIICTGLFDDHSETPDDYRALLAEAAGYRLPMVCANPDIVVNWGGRMIYCAGALAERYVALGGDVIYGGKPHAPIYDLARRAVLAAHAAGDLSHTRLLAVGDGVATDIVGANAAGIDAVYIFGAGGIHAAPGGAGPDAVRATLATAGAHARAAMESLRW